MKFFVIPPNTATHLMSQGTAGYYCLAHLYVKDMDYRRFFLSIRVNEPDAFILLDNGAAESSLVTEDVLLDIVEELHPDEVIAPDILMDGEATAKAYKSFVKKMGERELLGFTKIFYCPQGKNKQEWVSNYLFALNETLITTIGWSKIALPWAYNGVKLGEDRLIKESRHEAYREMIEADLIKKPIHMLGAGDPTEFDLYKSNPLIRSTDSAFSIVAALNGVKWNEGDYTRVPTPRDYFEQELDNAAYTLAIKNIEFLRKRIGR